MGEIILTAILGVAGSYITQFTKNILKVKDKMAVAVNLIISLVLAFVSVFLTGTLDGSNIAGSLASIFTLTTLAYQFLIKDSSAENIGLNTGA